MVYTFTPAAAILSHPTLHYGYGKACKCAITRFLSCMERCTTVTAEGGEIYHFQYLICVKLHWIIFIYNLSSSQGKEPLLVSSHFLVWWQHWNWHLFPFWIWPPLPSKPVQLVLLFQLDLVHLADMLPSQPFLDKLAPYFCVDGARFFFCNFWHWYPIFSSSGGDCWWPVIFWRTLVLLDFQWPILACDMFGSSVISWYLDRCHGCMLVLLDQSAPLSWFVICLVHLLPVFHHGSTG